MKKKQTKDERITELLDLWFELINTNVRNSTVRFKINNKYMESQCYYLFHNIHHDLSLTQFVSEYIYATYKILVSLGDLSNVPNQLSSAVCKTLPKRIREQVSPTHKKEFYRMVDGKPKRFQIELNSESIDVPILKNAQDLVLDELDEGNRLYDASEYKKTAIAEWLNDSKHKIMQKKQLEFYERLCELPSDAIGQERKQLLQVRDESRSINRIVQRIIKHYNDSKPNLAPSHLRESQRLVKLIKPIIDISERELDIDKINEDVFSYIAEHFDDIQPLVKLKLEEHQAVNRRQFNTLLVYKLFNQLEPIFIRETEKFYSFVYEPFQPVNDVRVHFFSNEWMIPKNINYLNLMTNGMLMDKESEKIIDESIHKYNSKREYSKKGDKNGKK